uniref:E3 ubiquitin-protein ligase listerin n=1 Tax=Gadus morhua TaxID=8049 RepID=A0A8C5BPB0_GADMO
MGGKNKQRTKGNVRPSSSGRAAELLARESGVVPGFIGFGSTVTSELGYVPAVHGVEEIDSLVDADFRLVLRKMSKRDTVTKLKAIQEFGTMCQERDAEEVKGVLPYWPRIYCKISVDHDRRVREATQQAFEQLVLKVRRSLAPSLKGLMGHWLMAQCDTYVPAASAACLAFTAAFPPNKQTEALSFCRDEILNVLQDTLLKETADTLSDPKSVPEEERETKFIRMLTSSLLGVKKLLHLLPDSDRNLLEDRLTQLISSAKFWKYSKHKTPQVRGALSEVVSALCQYTPGLVHKEAARASAAVLLSIDDTDPVVLPPLWEAVLHVVTTIPDCWTHVNARKGFLPKLWALLRAGGGGMAKALHPNLMPLVSRLPAEVTQPALDFYTTFFTSLIQGLSAERALTSPTESAAIVTAVVECMRFSVMQHTEEGEEQRKIQQMLISQQLLPLLESAVGNPSLQNGPLFLLVTEMLISWEKRAGLHGGDGSQEGADVYQTLLGDFWEGIGLLLVGFVDTEEADPKALEGVATLLQVSSGRGKKGFSISKMFEVHSLRVSGRDEPPEGEPQQMRLVGSLESERLEAVVCQLAQLCLVYVNEKQSERHLVFLSLLLRSFHTPRVFAVSPLSFFYKQSLPVVDLKNMAMRFLLERVVAWLSEEGRSQNDHLVDMIFSSLHCCSPQETPRILNHITMMNLPWGILLHVIQKSCRDWLKGSVLGERLFGLAEELCNTGRGHATLTSNENTHSWTLISLVLSQQHNNEPLIGEVYLEKILEKLHATLSETKAQADQGGMEPLICFICDVASTFYSSVTDCLLLASAEELLLTAFQITAQDHSNTHLSGGHTRTHTYRPISAYLQVLVSAVESVVEILTTARNQDNPLLPNFLSLLTPSPQEWISVRQALPPQVSRPITSSHSAMFSLTLLAVYFVHVSKEYPHSLNTAILYCMFVILHCIIFSLLSIRYLPIFMLTLARCHYYQSAIVFVSWFPVSRAKLSTLQVLCPIMTREERRSVSSHATAGIINWQENDGNGIKNTKYTLAGGHASNTHDITKCHTSESHEACCFFDLSKASADQLILTVEMMRFLSWLVSSSSSALGGGQWDFLLCCMLAWLETACENVSGLGSPWVQLFVCENASLIVELSRFFAAPPATAADTLPAELTAEWTDFFIEGIYSLLLHLPVKITGPDDPLFPLAVLRSVGVALTYIPVPQLLKNSLPANLIADQKTNLPAPLQTLLNTLCPLLLFKARPLQITVYLLLEKVMGQLPECDGEGESSKTEEDAEEPSLSPPESLMAVLSACEDLCESVLAGVQVGEFAVVQPLSVEYSCFLGYLLSWKLLLSFFKASPSQLRVQYSLYLKRSHSLHKLLIHLFKMMPENPAYPGQGADTKDTKTFFTESLSLAVDKTAGVEWELPHLACGVYYSAVQDLPAMVRLWWNSQEKRVSTAVERFSTRHVSPVLSAQEISSVHASTQTFDSMTVKARSAAREVIATYSVDDIFIELVIQLPQNHPLGSITVESGRRVGVAVQQWRNWMLQLSTYLTHQNGSIMEGLALWKNNVDKRFEGVEDCMICFSVIHGSNYSLPKKACRTCKKKFHSACLYKWFTSSNKSTCPLCRETFF